MDQHQLLNIHMEGAGVGRQGLWEGFIRYSQSWVGPKQSQQKVREKVWIQYMDQPVSKAAEGGGMRCSTSSSTFFQGIWTEAE